MRPLALHPAASQNWDEVPRPFTGPTSAAPSHGWLPHAITSLATVGSHREIESRASELERREADVQHREAVVTCREAALVRHTVAAQAILTHAEERNALSDGRDAAADKRENDLDLAELLAPADQHGYGGDWPERRNAALDRGHARADRAAFRDDLVALTEQEVSAPQLDPPAGL